MTARAWAQVHEWDRYRARKAVAAQARAEAAAAARPGKDVPAAPVVSVVLPAPRPAPEVADVDDDQELVLEDLTAEHGARGRYSGRFDFQGRLTGTCHDEAHPSAVASWYAKKPPDDTFKKF